MSTLGEIRSRFRSRAQEREINPRDVDLLLGEALSRPLPYLLAHDDEPMARDAEVAFLAMIERRFAGEPVQYIRGRAEFYGREFRVDRRVLIPRPETELLVESVLDLAGRNASVLDVGTGSGCIAATLSLERQDLRITASDRSMEAVVLARENAKRLEARVRFTLADLTAPFRVPFDVVASNPPYIPLPEYRNLQKEVLAFEPRAALLGGEDGLRVIDDLMAGARQCVVSGGALVMEVGFGQEQAVRSLAGARGWEVIDFRNDLAGIPRVVILERLA